MNLFELFVKIGVDDQASGKLSNLSSKLGNGLKTAAKIGTAAVGAAAAGITALTTAAVNNYAEYEQLVGGAQLMFGKAYDTVAKNAQDAYKTVQMSQNEYLQQVNGFATGLKTALGGNEQAAAELADRIITAEADIIAATGNTAENVQNAFNGIMKSNFTMLDNLQIGITPTKEGFQEVIDKVNEWNKANGEATEYQMGNLADMQSALVDYIEMQGYAGYASREAANTISGSIASAKSAWTNLLTGLADGNADIGQLVDNLVTTIVGDGTESNLGVLGNVMPAVKTALGGVSRLVSELLPKIVQEIPSIINENLPVLAEAAISIIQSLMDGISQNQGMLMTTAFETIVFLANSLISMLPQIVALGLDLIVSLANGIAESLPELIPTIVDVILQIVNTLTNPETLANLLNGAMAIITSIANYLLQPDVISMLLSAAVDVVNNLVTFLMQNLSPLHNAAIDIIMALVDYILDPDNIGKLVETAVEIVVAIAGGLVGAVGELIVATDELISEIIDKFGETDWGQMGKDLVSGFKKGIKDAWEDLKKWFEGLFDDLIGIAKKILGIASPSKVFKQLGKWTAEGFGIGWDDEFANVTKDIEDSLNFGGYDYEVVYDGNGNVGSSANGLVGGGVTVIQNIYSEAKTAADLMQEAIYQQERAVFLGV